MSGKRRVYDSDDDDDFFAPSSGNVQQGGQQQNKGPAPGTTVAAMLEDMKKKLQSQLIEGMFKYAESKYGRKRPQTAEEKANTKEDFELYLNSLKVKVKQATGRLTTITRQKKEIEKKCEDTQKEVDSAEQQLKNAEDERTKAENENRNPNLPTTFRVPLRSKTLGATLGGLVMKASKKDWSAALQDFAASRRATGGKVPEWTKQRNRSAALLKAGKNEQKKSEGDEQGEEETPTES